MSRAKFIIIPCLIIFLSSCASIDSNLIKYQSFKPSHSWMQEPHIGQPAKAEVGQAMTVKFLTAIFDGFISNENYEIKISDKTHLFPRVIFPEDEYIIWGRIENGDFIIRSKVFARAAMHDEQSTNLELALITRKNGEVYAYAPFAEDAVAIEKLGYLIKLEPQKVYVEEETRKELVYNGKTKDTVKLQYLEFVNDLAKPASYQDLTYDLAESKTIEFNGMMINIIEATDKDISFVVVKNMTSQ